MIKLIAIDLDDTLAENNKCAFPKDIEMLRDIEHQGVKIAICSGKPASYLCGFMRQAGLYHAIIMGENGASIQFGSMYPPEKRLVQVASPEARGSISFLRQKILEQIPTIWFQPNEITLTPFPSEENEHIVIEKIIGSCSSNLKGITVVHHSDSFDIFPDNISKKTGLELICADLHIRPSEVISIGNSENDYSMFGFSDFSIGINVPDKSRVSKNFTTLSDALIFLKSGLIDDGFFFADETYAGS